MHTEFPPPRRLGLVVLLSASILLSGGGVLFLFRAAQIQTSGIEANLVLSLVLLVPVPLLLYRAYSLSQAVYTLERDGLRIRWGLRVEEIPLPDIEWIRPANELAMPLPLPIPPIPGALVGIRRARGLGVVEFMAADLRHMLLVATPERIYVISPGNQRGFLKAFQVANELGSLTPIHSRSVFPAVAVGLVWDDPAARLLIITSLVLNLALVIFTVMMVGLNETISLGFTPDRVPVEPGPSTRMLFLLVLLAINLVANLAAGVYFHRQPGMRSLAYLLWGSSALMPVLLAVGIIFMVARG